MIGTVDARLLLATPAGNLLLAGAPPLEVGTAVTLVLTGAGPPRAGMTGLLVTRSSTTSAQVAVAPEGDRLTLGEAAIPVDLERASPDSAEGRPHRRS